MTIKHNTMLIAAVIIACMAAIVFPQENLPLYLKDRGPGIATSLFATYVQKGELLIYPYFEYLVDHNREYQPAQFALGGDQDFLAKYHSLSGQIFFAYGCTDWLAIEFEAAYMKAAFKKAPDDFSATPAQIKESGFGDVEGQIRLRLRKENEHSPEIFAFSEMAARSQSGKSLIGNPDWDIKPGIGIIKGFSWGTMACKTDLEYNRESSHLDIGETTVEFLRRLSSSTRLYLAIEGGEGGAPDEWDLISGLQWRITDFAFLKFDNAIGITPKASDWAPQIGLLASLPAHKK